MSKCKQKQETVCQSFEHRLSPLASPMKRLHANQIYEMMMHVKHGLCLSANPFSFASKILPSPDPLIRLRQNALNELEALCPLPVAKINVLNPSLTEQIHEVIMVSMSSMPANDTAFKDESVMQRALSKQYKVFEYDDDVNIEDYTYEIIPNDLVPISNFAKVPMQVGKWYPGMYSLFPDDK